MAAADFAQPNATLGKSVMMTMFEQFIMTGLLLGHAHTSSERLRLLENRSPRATSSAQSITWINLDAPITLSDVVEVSGVPGRTLFKHFQDWTGVSPMRYLRNARFQRRAKHCDGRGRKPASPRSQ